MEHQSPQPGIEEKEDQSGRTNDANTIDGLLSGAALSNHVDPGFESFGQSGMPKRATGLTDANARLHKNHAYELLVATWLMHGGWQVFTPLLDAAHAVDLIASDGPHSYRLQIKSVVSQEEHHQVKNAWKGRHIDFVIYFAQRSNWGYVCPAFATNLKRLDDPAHIRFAQNAKSFLAAFHACERPSRT